MTNVVRTYIKFAALTAVGRNPLCSVRQALRGYAASVAQGRAAERIFRESRLLETDAGGFQYWQTPHGSFWVPPAGSGRSLAMILADCEGGAYGRAAHVVGPDDIILDCGANIGVYSRQFASAGARLVIAVEPSPDNVVCLRRNLAVELASGRARIVEMGLWNEEARLMFLIDGDNPGGNSFITRNKGSYEFAEIPVTTIDSLVRSLGLERVDFIKMDIEAAEQKALEGARETLRRFRPQMAIAVEHMPDRLANATGVIGLAREVCPDYRVDSALFYIMDGRVLPSIVYFC